MTGTGQDGVGQVGHDPVTHDEAAQRALSRLLRERRVPHLPSIRPRRRAADEPSTDVVVDQQEDEDGDLGPDADVARATTNADAAARARNVARATMDAGDAFVDWVAQVIERYPRPVHPLTAEWDVSAQGIVRLVPYVPRFATAPLALLDRFGAVTVGPRRVGLDGNDVDWDRVVEIRTAPAWTCLSSNALEANLAQYVAVIPLVPGRGWVLRKVTELVFSLYLAVLPPENEADAVAGDATAAPDPSDAGPRISARKLGMYDRVVTEVVYRRRIGTGQAQAGVSSVLLQLAIPGSTDVIVRSAADRGVAVNHLPVSQTEVAAVAARAAVWRRSALSLREKVTRRFDDGNRAADPEGDEPEDEAVAQ